VEGLSNEYVGAGRRAVKESLDTLADRGAIRYLIAPHSGRTTEIEVTAYQWLVKPETKGWPRTAAVRIEPPWREPQSVPTTDFAPRSRAERADFVGKRANHQGKHGVQRQRGNERDARSTRAGRGDATIGHADAAIGDVCAVCGEPIAGHPFTHEPLRVPSPSAADDGADLVLDVFERALPLCPRCDEPADACACRVGGPAR
jgi:hypothetical protein